MVAAGIDAVDGNVPITWPLVMAILYAHSRWSSTSPIAGLVDLDLAVVIVAECGFRSADNFLHVLFWRCTWGAILLAIHIGHYSRNFLTRDLDTSVGIPYTYLTYITFMIS